MAQSCWLRAMFVDKLLADNAVEMANREGKSVDAIAEAYGARLKIMRAVRPACRKRQLAERAGVPHAQISNVEKKQGEPRSFQPCGRS